MRLREKKQTGILWLDEIPLDWEINKIKYTTYVKGRIGWQGLKSDEFIDDGPYLVTGTDLINGSINWTSCYHISEERYNEAPSIQLKENDLLITKDGTIGKVGIVKNLSGKAILNSGLFVTRSDKYLTEFMYWILNSKIFDTYIKYYETGSTIKHLYQETFENFSYPLPDKDEQLKIIQFLSVKVSDIDDLIYKKQELILLLEEKRQAIITEAVTKGLNPNTKMKDSGVEWIGEIPDNWKCSKFKYSGKLTNGFAFPSTEFSDNGVRVLKIANIQPMNIDWSDESFVDGNYYTKLPEYRVHKDDLVFALTRPIISSGIKAAIVNTGEKILLNQRNALYRSGTNIISSWLYYIMLHKLFIQEFESYIDRTGQQPNISSTDIENIKIPIPTLEEQQEIVDYLDQKSLLIDRVIEKIQRLIQKLKEYRQSLIYEVVTGKIDVRDFEVEQ